MSSKNQVFFNGRCSISSQAVPFKTPNQNLNLFSSQDYSSFPAGFFLGCKIVTGADLVLKGYHSYAESELSCSEDLAPNPGSSVSSAWPYINQFTSWCLKFAS